MNTLVGEILTLPKMSGSVSAPKSLRGNVGAKTINIGGKSDDGATFVPSVSADGIISWTNDKDLPNPEPVNIKGEKGADGTPATHRWSGTTLYITSASGTSSANLKGDKGDKGDTGATGANGTNGKDGYTPVKGVDYFDGRDGQPGKDGSPGKDGADGYTPIKGTDYFTAADKAEMVAAVKAGLKTEQWVFTLDDGEEITKVVYIG